MLTITSGQFVTVCLGLGLIAIYALERFNTPPSNRASTTAVRYYSAASAYILIYLLAYIILLNYPTLTDRFIEDAAEGSEQLKNLPANVVVALLLSILIPKVPILSKADSKVRRFLQDLAAIPIEALRLSKEIHDIPYVVPRRLQNEVTERMKTIGFKEENIVFEDGKSAEHLWTKITSVIYSLESWERDTRFAVFAHERVGQFERLKDRHKRLTAMAINCFTLVRQTDGGGPQDPMQQAVSRFCANFMAEADDLFQELCHYISQGVLKCKLTQGARCRELEDMGFLPPKEEPVRAVSINQVLTLTGILLLLLLVNFVFVSPGTWEGREVTLLMVTMIVSIYSIAVMCAVYPKESWAFFQKKREKPFPVASYLLSGIAAVLISIPISLFFKTLIYSKGDPKLTAAAIMAWKEFLSVSYPWMFMAFATAIFTAFLIDFEPPKTVPAKWHRWLEGAMQAGGTALASWFVHWWLVGVSQSQENVPLLFRVLLVSAIVGFVLGFIVPTWYSRAQKAEQTALSAVRAQDEDAGSDRAAVTQSS